MKGAEPHVIAPGFFKRNIIRNHLEDRGTIANFADFVLTDHSQPLQMQGACRRIVTNILVRKYFLFPETNKIVGEPG